MTTRCIDGRLMRHDPQHDDPNLETDIGKCPECEGNGCFCECCGAPLVGGHCADCAEAEETGREFAERTGLQARVPRFQNVSCSHCGGDFGPGDHGFSHCEDHRPEGWPPFREGQTIRIKNEDHLGLHRVESCEWFTRTSGDVAAYWLCECVAIREPIDWEKIPAGATGIVSGSSWRGDAARLIGVPDPACTCGAALEGKWADIHTDGCGAL